MLGHGADMEYMNVRTRPIRISAACIGLFSLCSPVWAQSSAAAPENTLTPVEQGIGDADPLRMSLRVPSGDLQQGVAFEQVYQGPDGMFYRVSGALYAQFDRSIYVPTAWGAAPVIPPGTIFYIGTPPSLRSVDQKPPSITHAPQHASDETRVPASLISKRIDDRVYTADEPKHKTLHSVLPVPIVREAAHDDAGTMSDEPTRRRRLAEIAKHARGTR